MKDCPAKNSRKANIDILKAFCAFLIVVLHSCSFPGRFGDYVLVLTRNAIPIFFMITGYFYYLTVHRSGGHGELRQLRKVAHLTILANIIYIPANILLCVAKHQSIDCFNPHLTRPFSLQTLIDIIVLNTSPIMGHLWYLQALFCVLICACFLKNRGRTFRTVLMLFLLAGLIFFKYSAAFLGMKYPDNASMNFLFTGLPFFIMGTLIYDGRCWIQKVGPQVILPAFAVCLLGSFLERNLLVRYGETEYGCVFFFTVFSAPFLFMTALSCPEPKGRTARFWAVIGYRYSADIYIYHIMTLGLCNNFLFRRWLQTDIYGWFKPLLVYFMTIFFLFIFYRIFRSVKNSRTPVVSPPAPMSIDRKRLSKKRQSSVVVKKIRNKRVALVFKNI